MQGKALNNRFGIARYPFLSVLVGGGGSEVILYIDFL